MGTTSEKLTYLNVTKQKLKQAINNIGGEVTDETTFRNYVAELENAYDRLPKTEFEEGESVTLENTLKGKLDFQDGKVGFGQAKQETTQGYQMYCLPPSKTLNGITYTNNGDGTCDIVGTATAQCDFALATRIPIAESPLVLGESYNISVLEAITGVTFQVVEYTSNGTWIATVGLLQSTQSQNVTLPNNANTAYIDYNIRVYNGSTINARGIKLMMNTGTSRKDFEQYSGGYSSPSPNWEQEIKCVAGNQDVVVSGKNEINVPEIVMSARTYIYRANIGSGNYSISITKSRVEGVTIGNQYAYMYKEIKFYDSNDTLLSTNTGTSAPSITTSPVTKVFNFTAPQNTSYMEIEFSNNNGDNNLNTLLSNVMLVSGTYNESTMPTYEPYITPTSYQLSLGDIELCKIGTYQDYIYKSGGKWYVHKIVKKTPLANKVVARLNTVTSGEYRFLFSLNNAYRSTDPTEVCRNYCNVAKGGTREDTNVQSFDCITYGIDGNDYYLDGVIYLNDTRTMTVEQFNAYASQKNIVLYYQLATPTDTEITATTLISQLNAWYNAHSLNGTTIITSNGDLPLVLKVRGLKGE